MLAATPPSFDENPSLAEVDARLRHLTARLTAERGELMALESEVARRMAEGASVVQHLNSEFARSATRAQRWADAVARVGGSWFFVIAALIVISSWMILNVVLGARAFDGYPFILLNLVLSTVAALQAPIIMMSQNRHSERDRLQADQDFLVNLKAELEISALQRKVDHLLHTRWESLLATQQLQLDLLQQLTAARRVSDVESSQ